MSFSEPPLTEPWRQLKQLLDSGRFSSLSATERAEWLVWAEYLGPECAIEIALSGASDKQRKFQRVFFNRADDNGARKDVFVALGGNRSGKSFACGWLCFALWLRDYGKADGWYWCVGPTLDKSIGGQQKELWKSLPRWMFGDQVWEPKRGFGGHAKLVLPTQDGGTCLVEFRSSDQDLSTFEQAKLDGVWIDEKTTEAVYGRLIPRLIDKRGFILYSDIPEQFWQFERLQEAPAEAGIYFQHFKMRDNERNLPEGEIERASARMSRDEREQKVEGKFLVMEGIVFREYDDTIHAINDFLIPPHWPRWRMIDYGASSPTACAWVALGPTEEAFIYREHYERNLTVPRNASMILRASGGENYVATLLDPHAIDKPPVYYGSSPTIADQYSAAGIRTKGWPYINVIGEHATVQVVKKRFEDRTLHVFKSCTNMRRELRSWKYVLDKEGRPKATDAYENDNNHLIDCIKGFLATKPVYTQFSGPTSERRSE